jgi:hypothetical protein
MHPTKIKKKLRTVIEQETDRSKVVSHTRPPHFTPQKHYYFYVSGTHFC